MILAALSILCGGASLLWNPDSSGRTQYELWLDPYYTAANATRALRSSPIPRLDTEREGGVYSWLMRRLFLPRDILVEASVNPLPVGGWALRRFAPESYEDAALGDVNFVEAATTGFPEPWAISVFLGNVVNLVSGQDTSKIHGIAYSGFLVSWGQWHLVENRLVRDDWFESEIKLKGDDVQRSERKLGWSFRVGWREHFNPSIHDAVYLAIKRKRTDFNVSGWDPFRNASIETRVDFDRADLPAPSLLRWSMVGGKTFPAASGKWAFTLALGLKQELHTGYDGDLREKAPKGWTLVLRPNVEW